jgi:hypothetical protein
MRDIYVWFSIVYFVLILGFGGYHIYQQNKIISLLEKLNEPYRIECLDNEENCL